MNQFPSKQPQGKPSNFITTLTVGEAIAAFVTTLHKPNNYPRVVRRYLDFVVQQNLTIGTFSRDLYFQQFDAKLGYNITSPIKKFLDFAYGHGIIRIKANPPKSKVSPAANELILRFLSSSGNLRGEKSKETYTHVLNAFFTYMEEKEIPFAFSTVTGYVDDLIGDSKSAFTINLYLSVIKQFAKWIVINYQRIDATFDQNQLENLRDIQFIRGLAVERIYYKESLTESERTHLLECVDDPTWKSIASLMGWCGLRSVEVPRLRVGDIDFDHRTLKVKGKGKHTYELIKLFNTPARHLMQYLESSGMQHAKKQSSLYPDIRSASTVQYQIKKWLSRAGLAKEKLSSHSLRHTAAQIMIDAGVSPILVQQQLRHASFDVTQFYVRKKLKQKFLEDLPDTF